MHYKKTSYQEGFQRPDDNILVAEFLMAIFQQQLRNMRVSVRWENINHPEASLEVESRKAGVNGEGSW